MLKQEFETWLSRVKACPQTVVNARSSNVARIEREKGLDVDAVFGDARAWEGLLAQFDYPMASWKKRVQPAHGISFGEKANWYNGTSTLRHALRLYGEFKGAAAGSPAADVKPAPAPAQKVATRKKRSCKKIGEELDSYQLFCDEFGLGAYQLYEFGLKSSVFAPYEIVVKQWEKLKKDLLTGGDCLTIRKYGRNEVNPFLPLYQHLFPKAKIEIDANGNKRPRALIQEATGYRINKTIFNFEISHVFSASNNPLLFNSLWNFFFCPKLIDPFTGHISKRRWPEEYQPLLKEKVFAMFGDMIEDYNRLTRELQIAEKIKAYVDALPEAAMENNPKARTKFLESALENWSELML